MKKQKPFAYSYWQSCTNDDLTQGPWVLQLSKRRPTKSIFLKHIISLYTSPQREWIGLADEYEKIEKRYFYTLGKSAQQMREQIEYLLELKQLLATMESTWQEKNNGLTEQQIKSLLSDSSCWIGDDCSMPNLNYIIRAVEKAHGIGEK